MALEAEKNSSTHTQEILRLSADDSRHLRQMIARYLNISREDVITAEHELKASLVRSQKLREEIDKSHVEGADDYLKERVELTAKIEGLMMLCKACGKYLKLLFDEEGNSHI